MKVYMYIAHLGAGGSERVCVTLANELIRQGNEVHIITLNLKKNAYGHILSEQCILHSLNVQRIRYSLFPLLKLLRKEKPESLIVFSHELLVWINYLKRFRLINTRIIYRHQNNLSMAYDEKTDVSPIVQKVLKANCNIVKRADVVLTQCMEMEKQVVEKLRVKPEKVVNIYNPVSDYVVNKAIALRKDRKKGHHIVAIGRLETQKNMEHMLRAFASLVKEKDMPEATLEIVGEGYEREKLTGLAKELMISEHISMDGVRQDIENVYAGADIVALSSTYEGMPNVLIEAISIGIPAISYDCPSGPSEIIVDGVNGYLAEYMNIDALADAMKRGLTHAWKEEAIRNSARKFSVKEAVDKYIKVLGNE